MDEEPIVSNSQEESRRVRFAFVELLFAFTIAEVGLQSSNLYKTHALGQVNYWLVWCHLTLCVVVIATSWVGWKNSKAPFNQHGLLNVFSLEFLVMLIDIAIVMLYFLMVKDVETPIDALSHLQKHEVVQLYIPHTLIFAVCLFGLYLLWDLVVNFQPVSRKRPPLLQTAILSRSSNEEAVSNNPFLLKGGASAICLVFSFLSFVLLHYFTGEHRGYFIDAIVLFLVLLFRALVQGIKSSIAFGVIWLLLTMAVLVHH